MKRLIASIFCLFFLLSITACGKKEEPVRFYYPNAEVSYHADSSVLSPEIRENLSREDDLGSLLALYLQGPMDTQLHLPVPEGTKLLRLIPYDGGMLLVMSREFSQLKGIDLTVVCAGISKTCFDLTDLQEITFAAGTQKDVLCILHRDSLVITDTVTHTTE